MSDDIIVEAKDGEAPAKAKGGKKKLMIIIGAAVLVLGGGGGGAAFFLMGSDKSAAKTAEGEHGEGEAEAEAEAEGGDHGGGKKDGEKGGEKGKGGLYVEVPPLVVNLRSADGAARFLKIQFVLVPGPASSADKLQEKLPLVIDAYQPFLRELRPEDLNGSGAVYRVKEELLVRATQVLGPDQVKDVLIQDLVQQ